MADVMLFGPSSSTYVRTARLACVEKGVAHELTPVELGSAAHARLHPFRRVPAMRHGDFLLYETGAIVRYVDAAFAGPPLQPAAVAARARMDQWISAISDYCYRTIVRGIVVPRMLVPLQGGETDEAAIGAAWPQAAYQMAVLDAAVAEAPYLAGDAVSLADFFLLPILFYARMQPEGAAALATCAALSAWFDRMAARPSFQATSPDFLKARNS